MKDLWFMDAPLNNYLSKVFDSSPTSIIQPVKVELSCFKENSSTIVEQA